MSMSGKRVVYKVGSRTNPFLTNTIKQKVVSCNAENLISGAQAVPWSGRVRSSFPSDVAVHCAFLAFRLIRGSYTPELTGGLEHMPLR